MPGKVLTINRTCADFTVGVQHLTTTEIGAYNLICDTIVTHGQDEEIPAIPDDDLLLASVTKLSVRAWRKMKPRLCSGPLAVLTIGDGFISQARVVEEIANAKVRMDSAASAGRASGESRRRKSLVLRERMTNARSTSVQTPVETPVEHSLPIRSEVPLYDNRTDHEPVMSHESRVTKGLKERELSRARETEASERSPVPVPDFAAAARVIPKIEAADLKVHPSDQIVVAWITEFGEDLIVETLADAEPQYRGKGYQYLESILVGRRDNPALRPGERRKRSQQPAYQPPKSKAWVVHEAKPE
jgi:uncharacterized protein YdaU (DUF1376 family)